MIVSFTYIGGIVDHHCLNFFFIIHMSLCYIFQLSWLFCLSCCPIIIIFLENKEKTIRWIKMDLAALPWLHLKPLSIIQRH